MTFDDLKRPEEGSKENRKKARLWNRAIDACACNLWSETTDSLPSKNKTVVLTISGTYSGHEFERVLALGCYDPGEGWNISGVTPGREDCITVDAWADLEAYGKK